MSDRDGRYLLAYDGEIYKFHYLRGTLAGRWVFETLGPYPCRPEMTGNC